MSINQSHHSAVSDHFANGDSDVVIADNNFRLADRSLNSLERALVNYDRRFKVEPAPARFSMRVQPGSIVLGDVIVPLSPLAWSKLAAEFKASAKYWLGLDESMRCRLANYHFERMDHLSSDADRNQLDVVIRDGAFHGFRRSDLVHMGCADVLRAICDGLGPAAEHFRLHRATVTDDSVHLELATPALARQVAAGDDIQGGIAVSHSILGAHATTVDLFTLRLACSNGLALRHCLGHTQITQSRRLKRKDAASLVAAKDQISRMTRERVARMGDLLQAVSELPATAIPHDKNERAEAAILRFLMPQLRATHLWSDALWRDVLSPAWRHEHGGSEQLTEFAAVNTVTYVASHNPDLTHRQRRTLARLAGLITYRRIHVCPRCHQGVVSA